MTKQAYMLFVLPALFANSLAAATYTWDPNGVAAGTGGTGNWDTSSLFWDNGALSAWPTTGTDNDALFDGVAGTVTLTTGISVNDMSFSVDGYSILGGTLTLNGTTPVFTVGAGLGASIGSTLAGSTGLTKAGDGTLTLSARNNTFTGPVQVGAGVLALSGTTSAAPVNVAAGATLRATGGAGLVGQYNAWTGSGGGNFNTLSALNNRFSSLTPALQYNGSTDASGNFDFATNGSKFPAPYNVSTTFEGRWIGSYTAPSDGSYTFFTASDDGSMLWIDGQLVVNNNFAQGVTERSGTITLNAGVHDIVYAYYNSGGGYGFYSNVTTPGGSKALVNNSALSSGSAIGSLTGDSGSTLELADTTNLTVNQSTAGTFAGLVTGPGGLFKTGTATLTLSNDANDYTGKTILGGGLVSVGKLADSGAVSGIGAGTAMNFWGGGLQYTGAGDTSNRAVGLTGNGTLEVTNVAANLALTGAATSLDANSTLLKTGPGTLTLGGAIDNPGLRASANAGTLLLDKASGAAVHAIGGALTVAGGTARLTGTGGDQIADTAGVTVNSGSFDLNARSETIKFLAGSGGSVVNAGATQSILTLKTADAGTQVYAGTIGGDIRVALVDSNTKNTHTQAFTGANTYTGGTLIDNGHLRIASDAALGAVPGAFDATNITIQNGGVLQNNDSSPSLDPNRGIYLGAGGGVIYSGWAGNNRTFTIPGAISGPGTLTRDDGAVLVLSGSSANTFAGNMIIRNGTTVLAKPDGVSAIGAGNLVSGSAGNGTQTQWSANEQIPDTSIIDFGTSGHMHLSLLGHTETVAGINATAGLGVIQNRQAEANINDHGTFIVNGAGDSTFNGYIRNNSGGSGAGLLGLVKDGTGSLTLSGTNISYTGGTTVNNGKLILGTGGANGTIRGTLTVNGPGVVEYAASNSFGYTAGASVNVLNINGGTVGNAGFNNHFFNNFQLNMTGGTLNLGGTLNEFSNPTVTTFASGTTAQIIAVEAGAVMRLRDNTSGTFNVADGAAAVDLEINAPITQSGTSGITKTGAGTLRLSGANSYSGITAVNGGTLALNHVNALQASTLDTGAAGAQQVVFALPGANTYNIAGLQGADSMDLGSNLVMIGSNNASTTYSGTLSGAGGALTKGGTGTFNLTGAATYTGATTVNAGRLNFAAGLGGDLVAASGTTISAGTSVGGAAAFNGVTYLNSNGPLAITGALTLAGTNTVNLKAPAPGTSSVTLMTYGGSLTGDATNLALANAATYRGTPVIAAGAGVVQITGLDVRNLTWTGAVNGNWNVLTTANWTDGAAQMFASGDAVTFDDSAAVKTVALPAGLVAPSLVTFNNSAGNDYTISGSGSQAGKGFTGATGIVKNGAGTVTIEGFGHNYTGPVTINAGVLRANGNNELLGNTSGVTIAAGGQLNMNGVQMGAGLRSYAFAIAGAGPDGLGAITNSSATQVYQNAGIRWLTLTGDASVGGNGGRFDIGLATNFAQGTITGNGFTLTKVGSNIVTMRAPATGITYVVNAGTLKFEDSDTATGANPINVNAGTLQAYGNRTFANAVNFAPGTTLDNDGGGNQTWSGLLSLGGTAAEQVNISARSGALNLSGVLSGAAKLVSTGGNTLTLSGANTYTGATAVNAGTLVLGGAGGAINASSAVTLGYGTTLKLDNLNTANNGDRLGDAAAITMNGATLNFSNDGIVTSYSETAGALSINALANTVQSSQAAAGQTAALTFASLARTAGAKVNFAGTGLGVDTRNRILFATAPTLTNGILGTWALVNNNGWATYDAALGVRELAAFTDVTRLTGNKTIADAATANVRIIEGTGAAASITLGSVVTTIHTLTQSTSGGATAATIDLAGRTLRLAAEGGVLSQSGSGALTLGTGASPGVLTAGGADNTAGLITVVNSSGNNITVNAVITDNGSGVVGVRKEGTGNLVYAGTAANTHTGTTIVDVGSLYLNKTGVAAISGPVQMGGGNTSQPNLRMQQSGQFAPGVVMSFANNSGSWARFDLAGTTQTLAGLNAGNITTQAGAIVQNKGLDNVSSGNSTLTLNGSGDYTYNGYIRDQDSGTGVTLALVKAGTGTQTLAGSQITYTGGTTVNGGTLVLASANVGRGAMTVNSGGTVRLTAGNAIDSLGAITLNAGGTMVDTVAAHNIIQPLTLNGGTLAATAPGLASYGNFVLGNNVTVGGTSTSVISADLRMGSNATRDFNVAVTGDPSGVDLDIRGYFSHVHNITWGYMSKSGLGTMRFASTSDGNIGKITVNAGRVLFEDAVQIMGNGGLLTNVDGVSEFRMNDAITKTYSGTIGGVGLLRKTGGGTMVFSGTLIDQTGTTAVEAGTLRFLDLDDLHAAALPISAGAIAEFQTSARNFNRFSATVISGGGTFVKSGAGILTTGNATGMYARWDMTGGMIDVRQGEFRADYQDQTVAWVNNKASLNVSAGATVSMVGGNHISVDALTGAGTVQNINNWGTGILTVGQNNGSGEFTGVLRDNGGPLALTKTGSGTQILSGDSSYTGATQINEGTLVVNGLHSAAGLVNVSAGATLGGSGSVGTVTVADGAILSPGNSAGNLTVNNLALNQTSVLNLELSTPDEQYNPASDFVTVLGNVDLWGVINITPLAGFGAPNAGDRWLIMTYGGGLADYGATIGSAPGGAANYVIDTSEIGSVYINVVVPESGTATLLVAGALFLLRLRAVRKG